MATANNGDLTREELEAALEYCHDLAETALEKGTRDELRTALETVSDIGHPDSLLDVDVENVTAEVAGWQSEDGDTTDTDDE
jgi:hypothetical protein